METAKATREMAYGCIKIDIATCIINAAMNHKFSYVYKTMDKLAAKLVADHVSSIGYEASIDLVKVTDPMTKQTTEEYHVQVSW